MPDKPRQVTHDLQGNPQITPAANPYYLFEYQRPAETEVQRFSGDTPLTRLSNALSEIDPTIGKAVVTGYQTYTTEEEAKNLRDFQANRDKWATTVKNGTIPVGAKYRYWVITDRRSGKAMYGHC